MTDPLSHLNRYSTPAKALSEPAPDDAELKKILKTAMTAPDHGRIRPYRFISIRGEARNRLSDVFGRAVQKRNPDVEPEYLNKQKDKPLRSPLIVVVVANLIDSPKIPKIEQMLCAGAAAQNILLASNALGYGSIWLTGDNAYDDLVKAELGVQQNEEIIGFIYLGTPDFDIPPRAIPRIENYLSNWE
ncbi:MAG: nitroreductase [Pseudomonadota bacterium]